VTLDVVDNAQVKKGQVLFEIDREPFEIAVRTAEANLEAAIQAANVSELDISYASADLDKQRIDRSTSRELGTIVLDLAEKDAVSETSAIRARSDMKITDANVVRAEVELRRPANAWASRAWTTPRCGRPWRRWTRRAGPAQHARAGARRRRDHQPQAAPRPVRRQGLAPAQFHRQRTALGQRGDAREPARQHRPGRPRAGRLRRAARHDLRRRASESLGWGVAQGGDTPNGQLPDITAPNGWLREPQRFPVRIEVAPVPRTRCSRPAAAARRPTWWCSPASLAVQSARAVCGSA
jgi:hypothetical protein